MRISHQLHAKVDLSLEKISRLPLSGRFGGVYRHSDVSEKRKILASSDKRAAIPRTSIP